MWPFDGQTELREVSVIYMSDLIAVEPSGVTPEVLKRKYTHFFMSKMMLTEDVLAQKLQELIKTAQAIKPAEADFRWGITITSKFGLGRGDESKQFFVAYSESKTIAKLGDHYFKLDALKAKSFLSKFNGVFGCGI